MIIFVLDFKKYETGKCKMLNEILNENLKNGSFLDIYREGYSRDAIFSKIIAVGEYIVAVAILDDNGLFDGISFLQKADISRIRKGGNELNSIEKLFFRQKQDLPAWNHPLNDLKLLDIITRYLKDDLLTVRTESLSADVSFIGRCIAHDDTWIKLNSYGTYGTRDHSELFLRVEDITRVDILSRYSRSLETIFISEVQRTKGRKQIER